MADGSIIIDTRIDTGGVSKGMNAVKVGMTRISAQVSKMGDSAKSSFQRQITAITDLYQRVSSRLPVRLPFSTVEKCSQNRLLLLSVESSKKSWMSEKRRSRKG